MERIFFCEVKEVLLESFFWNIFFFKSLKVLGFFFLLPPLETSVFLKASALKNCDSTLWYFE